MVVSVNRRGSCIACLMVVCLPFVLSGCGKQKSSYDLLSEAQEYHKKGQDNTAIIELKNALQKDPKNGEARYLFALIHIDRGEGAAAEIELRKALQLGVNKDKVYAALGQSLLLQQKYQKILDDIQPSDNYKGKLAADIYIARGDAYLGLGKLNEAKSAFDNALTKYPDSSEVHMGMARLAAVRGDLDEALHQTEIGLSKNSKNIKGWLMKAAILRMQEKNDAALSTYKHILEIDKKDVPARLGMASLLLSEGKIGAARTQVQDAHKISPKDLEVKYMEALLYYREGKYAQARDELQDVMKVTPDYMPGILLSGIVYYELGTYEQALQNLSRFIGQYPSNAYAIKMLAATELKLNQPDDALKNLNTLFVKASQDPQVLALAGQAYMQKGDYTKATKFLQNAASADPKNAALRAQLGASRLITGDTQNAVADLESAASMDPDLFKADALLVVTQLSKRDYAKALESVQAWSKRQPDNPVVYNLEGVAYLGKNDPANARNSFEHAMQVKPGYFPAAMNLAKLDLRDNKVDAAKRRFEDILDKDKDNLQATLALAGIAETTGDDEGIVTWLDKAIKSHPSVLHPRELLIAHYIKKRAFKKALEAAKDVQSAYPGNPIALDLVGTTQLSAGDSKAALATYEKLSSIVTNSPLIYYKLGQAQAAAGQSTAAKESLRKALRIQPDNLDAASSLATLELRDKNYTDARKIARSIQETKPKLPLGFVMQGDIDMARKDYKGAVGAYEHAFALNGGDSVIIRLHNAMRLAGRPRDADAKMAEYLRQHPDDLKVRAYLGDTYAAAGDDTSAIKQYRLILKQSPDNVIALNNLAELFQRTNDPQALDYAERAYKANPKNPAVADTLGWILLSKGDIDRCLSILKEASAAAPDNTKITYHYAAALAKSGDKAAARKRLKQLLGSGKAFPEEKQAKALLDKL